MSWKGLFKQKGVKTLLHWGFGTMPTCVSLPMLNTKFQYCLDIKMLGFCQIISPPKRIRCWQITSNFNPWMLTASAPNATWILVFVFYIEGPLWCLAISTIIPSPFTSTTGEKHLWDTESIIINTWAVRQSRRQLLKTPFQQIQSKKAEHIRFEWQKVHNSASVHLGYIATYPSITAQPC